METIGKENVINNWELTSVNGRKSFYGKAYCLETENYYYCKSYDTMRIILD